MGDEGHVTGEAIRCLVQRLLQQLEESVEVNVHECVAPVALCSCLLAACNGDLHRAAAAMSAAVLVRRESFKTFTESCQCISEAEGI